MNWNLKLIRIVLKFSLQSVTYEKKKFAEFLKTQNDGLELTRAWLVDHVTDEDVANADELTMRGIVGSVISRAYLELLSWSDEKLLPEVSLECFCLYL